jgi:hypothetical protein
VRYGSGVAAYSKLQGVITPTSCQHGIEAQGQSGFISLRLGEAAGGCRCRRFCRRTGLSKNEAVPATLPRPIASFLLGLDPKASLASHMRNENYDEGWDEARALMPGQRVDMLLQKAVRQTGG